ncbi:MAG: ABC transporter substrate-binding protein [Armatimonadetes bacterium]|nr:ABC transporter substrate-binding protein [Armatimonadota bacterium]
MTHRPLLTVVLLGALAALLSSARGESEPAAKQVAGPTIRFAYQDRVADAASVIAVEKGFFQKEGLAVKPLMFSSGPACTEALVSGSADIGTMGDTTAVISVARAPVTIIASHGGGEHRHRIIVKGNSPIRTPADLVGKQLAVKKGTSTYGGLLAWAQAVKLDLSQVKIIDMRPEDMGLALLSGAVDAVVASEPTPSVLEEKGGRELATLGGLGNNYPILLVARDDFLRKHPDSVSRFLRAMTAAAAFVRDHPDETAAIMAAKTDLSEAATKKALDQHYYRVQLDQPTRSSLAAIADFLVEEKILDTRPDLSKGIDDRYLPRGR